MLDPDVVVEAVVQAFRQIQPVVDQMGGLFDQNGNPTIYGHFFAYGAENSMERATFQMTSPSILVGYTGMMGGSFDGQTRWKHFLCAYIRPKNTEVGSVNGAPIASSPHLAWLLLHGDVGNTGIPFRDTTLLGGALLVHPTPTLKYKMDESRADLFYWEFSMMEQGDD